MESTWATLPAVELLGVTLATPPAAGSLEKVLAARNVACIASGEVGVGLTKWVFHAQGADVAGSSAPPPRYMAEVTVAASTCRLSAVVKGPDPLAALTFADTLRQALAPLAGPA